jgi:hypothetical protein
MRCFLSVFIAWLAVSAWSLSQAASVPALAYSPDGELLAAASGQNVLIIRTATGKVTSRLGNHAGRITAMVFSKDSRLAVASGVPGQSGVVKLYDPINLAKPPGEPLTEFTAHKDAIYALAFSPDGKLLATGSYDRTVKLWEVTPSTAPKLRYTLTDHSDAVYALAFHPSLPILATGSADRAVKVWNTDSAARLYTLSECTDWVYALAWTPDGKQLFAGGADRTLRAWEANATGGKLRVAAFAHDKPILKVAFSPDGQLLYSIGEDRLLKSWNPATLTERKVFPLASSDHLSLAIHPKGTQLALGQFDGTLSLLDPNTGKELFTPLPVAPTIGLISPNAMIRGKTTLFNISGTNLETITRGQSLQPGLELKIKSRSADGNSIQLEVIATKDATLGETKVNLITASGQTLPVSFFVDRFESQSEVGSTDSARSGMLVKFPVTVAGHLDRTGDTDFYRFEAKAGQELGLELITSAEQKQFEPVLSLLDQDGNSILESTDGKLGYTFSRAGFYAISIRDRDYRGGANYHYRLNIGPIPIVTSIFPFVAPRGQSAVVQVQGVNLPPLLLKGSRIVVASDAVAGSKIRLPVDGVAESRVGLPELQVIEGNLQTVSSTGQAEVNQLPGQVSGVLTASAPSHLIRFPAKKGDSLILESLAARAGSQADTFLEVLDAQGLPVPRVLLRAVAKTFVTFRDHDSANTGLRLDSWNEFAIDDYAYLNGEVLRILALPSGPDADCRFYNVEGRRVGFFDTTPIHQAQGSLVYKVEVHPAGAILPSNGLPSFKMYFQNDDGGPGFGKDSRIFFTAPADGIYQLRVSDANRNASALHSYHVTIRKPTPSFTVRTRQNPNVWKGEAVPMTFTASRQDGFDGPIRVRFADLPSGWSAPAVTIGERQESTSVTLMAASNATMPQAPFKLIAEAEIAGKPSRTEFSAGIPKLVEPGDVSAITNLREVTIKPGSEARIQVTIQRRGDFKGRVPIEVKGLPHGVRVLDIGLNGILITPDVVQREVVLYAEPWVKDQDEPFVVLARSERKGTEHAAPSVLLKVRN